MGPCHWSIVMNGQLLTKEEKARNRRERERRKSRKKLDKRRESRLAAVFSPLTLTLIEAGILTGAEAFSLVFGSMRSASKAMASLRMAQAAVMHGESDSEQCSVATPRRKLQATHCGMPVAIPVIKRQLTKGLRLANLQRAAGLLPAKTAGLASLDPAGLQRLLPGISVPLKCRRDIYLVRIVVDPKGRLCLECYSARGNALFRHSIPLSSTTTRPPTAASAEPRGRRARLEAPRLFPPRQTFLP